VLPPDVEELWPPDDEEVLPPEVEELWPPDEEEVLPPEVEELWPPDDEEVLPPEVEELWPPDDEDELLPPEVEDVLWPPEDDEVLLPPEDEDVVEPPEVDDDELDEPHMALPTESPQLQWWVCVGALHDGGEFQDPPQASAGVTARMLARAADTVTIRFINSPLKPTPNVTTAMIPG
jgi:hypothetical protein